MIGQLIVSGYFNTYVNHLASRAQCNKHVKQVKLSYTAPFDVLTRETVFSGRPRVSGWIEVFEKGAYVLSPFLSLRFSLVRFFSTRSLFSLVR